MEFTIKTSKREEIADITQKVRAAAEGKKGKACLVFVPHTTCSVIISENNGVYDDVLDFLSKLVPRGKWKHDKIDDNADAHLKANLLGSSRIVPIENGKLCLGTWQQIALAEFDGPRERRVIVRII